MKTYSMFLIRRCRGLNVKGGHDLIRHWRAYTKIVAFLNFFFIYSVIFCASDSPFAHASCICPPEWNTREITPVMQSNPELKGMNDLYGKQLAQKRELTESAESSFSRSIAYFFGYQQNGQIFLYHLFETSVSTRIRMYILTRWSLPLHSNGLLFGIFPIAKTSLITISDVPLSIWKLA